MDTLTDIKHKCTFKLKGTKLQNGKSYCISGSQ